LYARPSRSCSTMISRNSAGSFSSADWSVSALAFWRKASRRSDWPAAWWIFSSSKGSASRDFQLLNHGKTDVRRIVISQALPSPPRNGRRPCKLADSFLHGVFGVLIIAQEPAGRFSGIQMGRKTCSNSGAFNLLPHRDVVQSWILRLTRFYSQSFFCLHG